MSNYKQLRLSLYELDEELEPRILEQLTTVQQDDFWGLLPKFLSAVLIYRDFGVPDKRQVSELEQIMKVIKEVHDESS